MPPSPEEEKIERLRRAMYSRKYGDQLGQRERRELSPEEQGIPDDWPHDESEERARVKTPLEQFAALRRERPRGGILKWMLLIAVVFFLGAVAFFVYYLFFGGSSAISARNIDIAISGPAQIPGGELTDLEISVANRNREALENAQLVVSFPPGTRLNAGSCSAQSCTVQLGEIAAGGSEVVKLPAVYEGGAGQSANVSVELQYNLAGSAAIFEASSDYAFTFSSSPISLSVSGNTQTVSGQPMQMTVTVSSNADQPVSGIMLAASFPFGFKLTNASPAQGQNGLWNLGTLSPGQAQTITVNGVLNGAVSGNHVFQFTAGTESSASSTGIDAPLAQGSLSVAVAQPFLGLAISVDDATSGAKVTVSPGDIVNVAISYQNNLASALSNAVVVAKLSGFPIDGTTVHAQGGFFDSNDDSILWDKTTSGGALASLAAGASGTLNFSFQVPSTDQLSGVQNPVLDISVSAAGQQPQTSGTPENLQSTADQKIAVASDLQLSAQGLYFTDPFGASGPMPPSAGTETTYAVAFTITNTTNQIDNAVVTAQLPPYVRLVGNHYLPASEKVNFNSNTGLFTWNVGTIAPGAGLNGTQPRQVVIEVGFTPSTSQIGTSPSLVQDITLQGADDSTGQSVSKTAPDVTTNILGDPGFESINAKVVAPSQSASQ